MVKLLFCLELIKYSMFDSARYIVDSIDAVARTIVAAHSTSTACGPNKRRLYGVNCQWQKPFCLALHQPAIAFTIAPCPDMDFVY